MNRRRWVLTVLATLLALTGCDGRGRAPEAQKTETHRPESSKQGRKILYWRSPMDPTYVAKGPGKDPMGMDLVPVYAGEAPSGPPGVVRIDPVTVQNIGVKTVVVERKRLDYEIRTVGRIAYDESKVRRISPKIGGWIEGEHVNFRGQVVEDGERLLEIYSPDLVSTQEEYLVALRYRDRMKDSRLRGTSAEAEGLVKSAETRLRYWNITPGQIRALRERGEVTRTMVLYAPFKGIVVERYVPEGGHVQAGQTLYEIADLSTVWVYAEVYAYETPWMRLGQAATMTLAYGPGTTYEGKVDYIYPYVENKTRTIQVRMKFANSRDFDLKPDMWANVVLRAEVAREGLAVPIQAVLRTGKRDIAIVALEGGHFLPRDLRLGVQAGDEFEVLSGLREGERVVTSAEFLINSASSLQAALSKMIEPKSMEESPPGASHPEPANPAESGSGMKSHEGMNGMSTGAGEE